MTFKISFKSDYPYAINLDRQEGIQVLDKTRSLFNLPEFPAEKILAVESRYTNYFTEISEEIARESDLFERTNSVSIKVSPGFLNQFAYLEKYDCTPDKQGKYDYLRLKHAIDKETLLYRWQEEGFPTEWDEITLP